jgi:hypothetical protein
VEENKGGGRHAVPATTEIRSRRRAAHVGRDGEREGMEEKRLAGPIRAVDGGGGGRRYAGCGAPSSRRLCLRVGLEREDGEVMLGFFSEEWGEH